MHIGFIYPNNYRILRPTVVEMVSSNPSCNWACNLALTDQQEKQIRVVAGGI